ncbi:MAG: type II secretion system protein [Candidatus Paceibacterota bacterium]|jgi:prepilin-type N-terminal cleavage/methylation domain-containing protein
MTHTKTSGFTLIETLIAVTILTFATAGPLYTASRALVAAEIARDQLTASYLAQEGVEYVRAMRDYEYLTAYKTGDTTAAWTNFRSGSGAGSIAQCRASACTLDPTLPMGYGSGSALAAYSGDAPLYLTNCTPSSTGVVCTPPNIYTQRNLTGSMQTPFTRTIQVSDVAGTTEEEQVVSTVSWSFHGTPYIVTVTNHVTAWQ